MAAFGDSYEREMQNMPNRPLAEPLFDPELIDRCVGPHPLRTVTELGEQSHFFVGVDPGSAQARSDTAIVSMCFACVLPGLETRPAHIPSLGYGVVWLRPSSLSLTLPPPAPRDTLAQSGSSSGAKPNIQWSSQRRTKAAGST